MLAKKDRKPAQGLFTGMARSHEKQAYPPVGASHAREKDHTPARAHSRAWPVPTKKQTGYPP